MRSQMPKMLYIPDEHFYFLELEPIDQLTLILQITSGHYKIRPNKWFI